MSTCLFTGEDLSPETAEEHALLRSLGGRIRSRRVSCDRFNNATSNGFDDLLAAPYAPMFNYLAPLLAREHAQAALAVMIGSDRYLIHPGGELSLRGTRIDRRDEHGRPVEVAAEDPAVLEQFAQNAGWPVGAWRRTDEIATTATETSTRAPILHPRMEVAALKCALLAFDEVLGDDTARFTRSGWLSSTRAAIRDVVLADHDPAMLLDRVSWGLNRAERDELVALRRQYGPARESSFEHLLVAAGDPVSGSIDLAWLLADTDVWTFRLTHLWNGAPFTAIAGCGTLRDTERWPPVVLHRCLWQLSTRTNARSVHHGGSREEMRRLATGIAAHRHEAFRRAVDLVERRCEEVVVGGTLTLSRFPEAEPIIGPGETSIRRGLERRLRRLFFAQCEDAKDRRFLEETIEAEVGRLPESIKKQSVQRADDVGQGVNWTAWVGAHRRILDLVAPRFGLPGHIYSISVQAEPTP